MMQPSTAAEEFLLHHILGQDGARCDPAFDTRAVRRGVYVRHGNDAVPARADDELDGTAIPEWAAGELPLPLLLQPRRHAVRDIGRFADRFRSVLFAALQHVLVGHRAAACENTQRDGDEPRCSARLKWKTVCHRPVSHARLHRAAGRLFSTVRPFCDNDQFA